MTDIPDEIMRLGRDLADVAHTSYLESFEIIARAIMEAEARGYAAAREQAAKIADGFAETWGTQNGKRLARLTATAIRAMEMSDE
jgi:hypothetical protein